MLCCVGRGLAHDFAARRQPARTAECGDHRQPHAALDTRKRGAAAYDGAKRKKGTTLHLAVDTRGHPLALHVTPANADDRAEIGRMAKAIQAVTGDSIELAFVDQGYTGQKPIAAAAEHGIALEVVKLSEAKLGFVLLPRRWVVERSFAWATRFRCLVKDYERCAQTLADLLLVAFACIMLRNVALLEISP